MPLTVYKASAGSGKTTALTQSYLQLLKKTHHKHILAVTFTNKATQEMKERIVETLHLIATNQAAPNENQAHYTSSEAANKIAQLLHNYSYFNVSTIDGFYQQIMRSFVRELGLYGGYSLVLDQKEVVEHAIDDLILSLHLDENKHLYQWLLASALERIKKDEKWQFRSSLTALTYQLFKEDVAESIKKLQETPNLIENISALKKRLTEQNKQLLLGIMQRNQTVKDIWETLQLDYERDSNRKVMNQCNTKVSENSWPTFTDSFLQLANSPENVFSATYKKAHPHTYAQLEQKGFVQAIRNLVEFIESNAKEYHSAYAVLKQLDFIPVMLELDRFIQQYLRTNNMVLLSQVNGFLHDMINQCDAPFIYEKMGYYIHHYMLDEFQDTSLMQWSNFKPLITESLGNNFQNLVVGDIKQSIYRWRNSDWRILAGIQNDFSPAFNIQESSDDLKTNWRSDGIIVRFNTRFFSALPQLFSHIQGGELLQQAYQDVHQEIAPGKPIDQGLVQITWLNTTHQSTEEKSLLLEQEVLRTIETCKQQGYPYKDIALLVDTNAHGIQMAQCLLEAGIPIVSSESLLLTQCNDIRLLIALLRLAYSFQPEVDNYKIQVLRALNEEKLQALTQAMQLPLFEAIEQMIQILELNKQNENTVYLQAFQDLAHDYSIKNSPDIRSFLDWWDRSGKDKKLPGNDQIDAVQITTIHKSKGLAYPIVIMPYASQNIQKTNAALQPILWCSTQDTPYSELPFVPVQSNKTLANSYFAAPYHTEQLYQVFDFINTWYVAFTRPRNGLFIIAENANARNEITTGSHVLQHLINTHSEWMDQVEETAFGSVAKVGILPQKEQKPSSNAACLTTLPYYSHTFIQYNTSETSQQHIGNVLHKILQYIVTADNLEKAIEKACRMGILLPTETDWARTEMTKLLAHPGTKTWFNGTYPTVWNERSIITNHTETNQSGKYRPDRLLVKDKEIVVVDYKFGKETDKHREQMQRYMESLRDMNKWDKIEGFLYYHQSYSILPVSI